MSTALLDQLESLTGVRPHNLERLSGGCVGEVYKALMPGGDALVAKTGLADSFLDVEGNMLRYLGKVTDLPVPEVLHASPELLVMTWLASGDELTASSQTQAAEMIAALHSIRGPYFGFGMDTVIGGIPQPNPETARWVDFFRDHRLLYMAEQAANTGRLLPDMQRRLEVLCGHLDQMLPEPRHPSLLHGDLWTGNILVSQGQITGFIDPALYFGHPEVELAFSTLFGTFGEPFFRRYMEIRGMDPDFFEERRDLYNIYPVLVHIKLFGGSYVPHLDNLLTRFGV